MAGSGSGADSGARSDGESRRAWRERTGARRRRVDPVWDFAGWFALFPGMAMIFAAVGGGRSARRWPMDADESWAWVLVGASAMFVLVAAMVIRRASGVTPSRYPGAMFITIVVVTVLTPASVWVRLGGVTTGLTGWTAGVCVTIVVLSTFMLVPPRASMS